MDKKKQHKPKRRNLMENYDPSTVNDALQDALDDDLDPENNEGRFIHDQKEFVKEV